MTHPAAAGADADGRPVVALSIGKFDGVHLGHRRLVSGLVAAARDRGARSVALVLAPHPAVVLAGRRVPQLTDVDERRRRLAALGVDEAVCLAFTPALAGLSPEAFLDDLAARYRVVAMVVGADFVFGKDRAGDVETLRRMGRERGFDVVCVPPVIAGGEAVSSRRIRHLVETGHVAAARALMAAPPRLVGTVVRGAQRGRTLGFPTANLAPADDYVVPGHGIYTVRARWDGAPSSAPDGWMGGVASIGVRPTFDDGPRSIEVYVLDFAGDLYGRTLTVEVLAWQRGEERFDGVEPLVAQMHRDVALARANLAAED